MNKKLQDMDIIQMLTTADFSTESRARHILKRKLLDKTIPKTKDFTMNTNVSRTSFSRLALTGVVILLVALTFILPKTAVAQSIVNILHTWTLGSDSTAVQVEGDFIVTSNEAGEIVIQPVTEENLDETDLEDFVDESLSSLETSLSFEDAAGIVNFHIFQPAFIPEGYESQGVIVVNEEKIQMDYMKASEIGLVGLTQTLVNGINGPVQLTFSDDIVPVDVQVNGNEGLWITDPDITDLNAFGLLIWDDDGVNYQLQLMGPGANLKTALKIAESLQ